MNKLNSLSFIYQSENDAPNFHCCICSKSLSREYGNLYYCNNYNYPEGGGHRFSFYHQEGSVVDLYVSVPRNDKTYEATIQIQDQYADLYIMDNEHDDYLFNKTFDDFDFNACPDLNSLLELMDTYLLFS